MENLYKIPFNINIYHLNFIDEIFKPFIEKDNIYEEFKNYYKTTWSPFLKDGFLN